MINKEDTEEQLVERLKQQDQQAWKDFFTQFSGILHTVAMRYLDDYNDINDVIQNGFIKMFHAIHSFHYRGKGALKAWSTRIIANEALTFIKKQQGEKSMFETLDDTMALPEEVEPDLEFIPTAELLKMIQELPVGYRTVLNMYVFEQKSHKEIASELGIHENSSASQFHRAKSLLSAKINQYKQLNSKAI